MKIVRRKELLACPPGTLFVFENRLDSDGYRELRVKGETTGDDYVCGAVLPEAEGPDVLGFFSEAAECQAASGLYMGRGLEREIEGSYWILDEDDAVRFMQAVLERLPAHVRERLKVRKDVDDELNPATADLVP